MLDSKLGRLSAFVEDRVGLLVAFAEDMVVVVAHVVDRGCVVGRDDDVEVVECVEALVAAASEAYLILTHDHSSHIACTS